MAIIRDGKDEKLVLKVNADGSINAVVSGSGSFEISNEVGNPIPVSGTVAVTQATAANLRAQTASESATAAAVPTTGTYIVGNVTTNNPTYATATANALSLTTGGSLRVQLTNANTNISATNPAPVQLSQGNAATSATNPIPVQLSQGNAASSITNPIYSVPPPSIVLNTQSAANTAATLTIPAVAGQFHYITGIILRRANTSAADTIAAATNLTYSTTNLNGFAVYTGNATSAGTTYEDFNVNFGSPVKSSTVNTATTITAPAAGAGVQTQIIVTYYAAP